MRDQKCWFERLAGVVSMVLPATSAIVASGVYVIVVDPLTVPTVPDAAPSVIVSVRVELEYPIVLFDDPFPPNV
ncbi:MAG TPA: hypothetical protein VFW74_14855, partial [Acidimicrobiia bacterium]|nr:hypothetical protein [Acidimicrobiia bacterium]